MVPGGRSFDICRLHLRGQSFRIMCVYAPNDHTDRKAFLAGLYPHLGCNHVKVLGGDFNFVEDLSLDKSGGGDPRAGNIGLFQMSRIRADFRLVDAFRSLYPNRRVLTYAGQRSFTRLDQFYFDSRHSDCIFQCSIVPSTFTDHSIVALELTQHIFSSHMSGPGYWKCNTSILTKSELHEEIGSHLGRPKTEFR